MTSAEAALAVAAALHLGFQLTVTALVYPALARVPEDRWREAHDRHSRVITPIVGATYAALVLAAVVAWVWSPGWPTLAASLAAALTVGVTAIVAAPLHGRLGRDYDARLLRRLLRADRLRTVGAALCLTAALIPLVT